MDMPDRIKERRIAANLTQEELAEKLGLQKSAIAKYENGRVENIKRSVIQNMADILHCKPSYLLAFEEETPAIIDYYNTLNILGKETATEQVRLLTLDKKYTAHDNYKIISKTQGSLEIPDHLLPNAAHERTDIEVTEEMRKTDDDIMDDNNF